MSDNQLPKWLYDAKCKAKRRFHEDHDDGDLAIAELVRTVAEQLAEARKGYVPNASLDDVFSKIRLRWGDYEKPDGTDAYGLANQDELKEAILAWHQSELNQAVEETRLDENNTAFLRILKIGRTQGLSAKLLVSYHDKREAEIKATQHPLNTKDKQENYL